MDHLLQQLGLNLRDALELGILVGVWIATRGRRRQGERLGQVEQLLTKILAARGASGADGK